LHKKGRKDTTPSFLEFKIYNTNKYIIKIYVVVDLINYTISMLQVMVYFLKKFIEIGLRTKLNCLAF